MKQEEVHRESLLSSVKKYSNSFNCDFALIIHNKTTGVVHKYSSTDINSLIAKLNEYQFKQNNPLLPDINAFRPSAPPLSNDTTNIQTTKYDQYNKVQPVTEYSKGSGSKGVITQIQTKDGLQIAKDLQQTSEFVKVIEATKTSLKVMIRGDYGAVVFREKFQFAKDIKSLYINAWEGNKPADRIGKKGWSEISMCLADLEEVGFSGHNIQMDEAIMIYVGLRRSIKLASLDLWKNNIDSTVALFLVENLMNALPSLKSINLGENDLDGSCKLKIKQMIRGKDLQVDVY